NALPEPRQLGGIATRHFLHVGRIPIDIAVTLVRVAHVAVWERLHLRPLAREGPLRLGAQALAGRCALDLSLMEAVHHLRPFPLLVGPGVLVHAKALLHALPDAAALRLELLADRLFVGLVVPALQTLLLDLGAIFTLDELH